MKNIYDDNQIMSPDIIDKIAREYSKQKQQSTLSIPTLNKLQNNLCLLEYLNKNQKGTSVNLQKCLIKTYSIIKSSVKNLDLALNNLNVLDLKSIHNSHPKTAHNSFNQAKQQILQNSLYVIKDIISSYKNIFTDVEIKTINVSLENICDLLN